jgi:hypothetical protein
MPRLAIITSYKFQSIKSTPNTPYDIERAYAQVIRISDAVVFRWQCMTRANPVFKPSHSDSPLSGCVEITVDKCDGFPAQLHTT